MFGLFNKTKSYEDVSAADFAQLMKQNNAVLLDVRTRAEYASGYIKGAKNIDVSSSDFVQKVGALDKSKTYLVYCKSGMRSSGACSVLSKMGFENLHNLSGGIMSWKGKIER